MRRSYESKIYMQKQSILSHLIILLLPLIELSVAIIFLSSNIGTFGYITVIVFLCADFVPSLILYLNYLFHRTRLKFRISETEIEISDGNSKKTVTNSEIRKIEFQGIWNTGNFYLTWFSFYWGTIALKNGNNYVFTSLDGFYMKTRLKKMKGVFYNKVKKFPLIPSGKKFSNLKD
ncbi:hypothetical protein ACE01N_20605 [Saccharicrinis sp. FJH2]|uniref:hypothetical protein n=1 Tax=Saccharicrinis sp. FJH65 TaxID=3344659 RepID=UPI0035F4D6D6